MVTNEEKRALWNKQLSKTLLFYRLDGGTDTAKIRTRQDKHGYWESHITIGSITKRVVSGMIKRNDAINNAMQQLFRYKDNVVL